MNIDCEANEFAAELLVPTNQLMLETSRCMNAHPDWNSERIVKHLAKQFDVSELLISSRLGGLGAILV